MNKQKINMAKSNVIKKIKHSPRHVNYFFTALVIIFLVSLIRQVNANELETTQLSISYGVLSQAINTETRSNIINQNYASLIADQIIGKATGKSRDEIQNSMQTTSKDGSLSRSTSRSYVPEFSIYDAFTTLQDDFDSDGFYRTFSVVFDADIYSYDGNDIGAVYARLYLSEDGGPWYHYYTTDDFIIHSDGDQDEYEIITTFASGYHSGHYDVLIDLYQVGYDGIVATYSADNNQALYGLPLESADYDRVYVETVEIHHGGSLSILSLILLLLFLSGRLHRRFSGRDIRSIQ